MAPLKKNYEERIRALYDKLSSPRVSGTFHRSPEIEASIDNSGSIIFQNLRTQGLLSPAEMIDATKQTLSDKGRRLREQLSSAKSTGDPARDKALRKKIAEKQAPKFRDIREEIGRYQKMALSPREALKEASALQASFSNLLKQPDARQILTNAPVGGIEGTRAAIYRRAGFVDVPEYQQQVLDNRRFSNFPAIEEMYRQLDEKYKNPATAQALQQSREQQRSGRLAGTKRMKSAEYYIQPQRIRPGVYEDDYGDSIISERWE